MTSNVEARNIEKRAAEALRHESCKIFCIYPLGILLKRSYDGGLSFLAKIQVGAENGV